MIASRNKFNPFVTGESLFCEVRLYVTTIRTCSPKEEEVLHGNWYRGFELVSQASLIFATGVSSVVLRANYELCSFVSSLSLTMEATVWAYGLRRCGLYYERVQRWLGEATGTITTYTTRTITTFNTTITFNDNNYLHDHNFQSHEISVHWFEPR